MELKILQIREATGETITSTQAIADLMAEESKADRECFWVLHLDSKLQIIEKELVAVGILSAAYIHPREVFKKAIINSACSIITVHNHPSGDPWPSTQDSDIWRILVEAGKLLGIRVEDNLIIGPSGKFYSDKTTRGGDDYD